MVGGSPALVRESSVTGQLPLDQWHEQPNAQRLSGPGAPSVGHAPRRGHRGGNFIAIPAGLARYFESIDADLTAPTGVFDTHKVAGYLARTTTAAGALATLLGR